MPTVYTFSTGEGSPDFTIRSGLNPDVEFHVQRSALVASSDVFNDMFSVCLPPEASWVDVGDAESTNRINAETSMEMPENADVLQMLFRVIHEPPVARPEAKQMYKWEKTPGYMKDPESRPPIERANAIPLPLLKNLFVLADKYQLKQELVSTLHTHLAVHAFDEPLQVYALATRLELEDVANFASSQLLSPPLETYSVEELEIMPSIKSLHLLYKLHAHRKARLQEILANEPLFPHGYGRCKTRNHAQRAENAWIKQKGILLSMGRLQAGTDIASEMGPVLQELESCETCIKAFKIATDMLEVCIKVPIFGNISDNLSSTRVRRFLEQFPSSLLKR